MCIGIWRVFLSHTEVCVYVCVFVWVPVSVCHFVHPPESRWLSRSMEGGGGRVSRGSCLIDVFWGVEESRGGSFEDEEGMEA